MNSLLKRQLRKCFGDDIISDARFSKFVQMVDQAYSHLEEERAILDLSLERSSAEMGALNEMLMQEANRLKAVNHELNTLIENLDNVYFSIDLENKCLNTVSPAFESIYGYTQEEFAQDLTIWLKIVDPRDQEHINNNYILLAAGHRTSADYRIITKSGQLKWIETKFAPRMQNGVLIRIDAFSSDITFRKEIEEKIVFYQSRFRHLIEKSQDGVALLDRNNKVVYVSPAITKILGYSVDDLSGIDAQQLIHKNDQNIFINLINELSGHPGKTVTGRYRVIHRDSTWRWMQTNATNLLHDPAIDAIVFNFQDITEKIETEHQLEFDRRNRDALINSTNDLMWSIDTEKRLITANRPFIERVFRSTGVRKGPGDQLLDPKLYNAESLLKWKLWYDKALQGQSFTVEDLSDATGQKWASITFNPIMEFERVIGVSVFLRDISESKRSLEIISRSERMMAEAQRIAHFGSWELTLQDSFSGQAGKLSWSDEILRIMGLPPGQVAPSFETLLEWIHEDDRDMFVDAITSAIREVTSLSVSYRIMRPDRSIRWIRAKADVITDAGGNPMKLIGTAQDITDRKFNQEERRRIEADLVQRNKDLEQFTYIISHNLRAPVANIRGLASLIQSHELDDESHAKCLAGLEASVRRLDDILIDLNNILQVRREISEKRSKVAFNDVVNEILADMRQILVKEQVSFKVDFSAAPEVFSIKGYIHSIFYNLISNSIKYRRPGVAPEIVITSELSAGRIVVKFRDNGLGFDGENQREKVFGLYKRFHQHVEGKGVGLFMVKTQVETLGGRVDVESAVNKGAEFTLELPA